MAIDFSQVKEVKYNNQDVTKIERSGVTLWEKDPLSQFMDLSSLNVISTKGTPDDSTTIAGKGLGDINKDSLHIRVYVNGDASNISGFNTSCTTGSSGTNCAKVGLFYGIGTASELNYNNSSTAVPILWGNGSGSGTTSDPYEWGPSVFWNSCTAEEYGELASYSPASGSEYSSDSFAYYDFTINRAYSSTYPLRFISVGSQSAVYWRDSSTHNMKYILYKESDNKSIRIIIERLWTDKSNPSRSWWEVVWVGKIRIFND